MRYQEGDYIVNIDKLVAFRTLGRIYDFHLTVYYQEEKQENEVATAVCASEGEALQKAGAHIKYHKVSLETFKEAASG